MHNATRLIFIGALLCIWSAGAAEDPSCRVRAGSVEGLNGTSAVLSVYLDLDVDGLGEPVDGWSFGICHAENAAAVLSAEAGDAIPLLRDGAGVDFLAIEIVPGGVTETVIVDLGQAQAAPARNDLEVLRIRYLLESWECPATRSVDVCGTLGTPPVDVVCVVDRAALEPQRASGAMKVRCTPLVTLQVEDDVQAATGRPVAVPLLLSNERPVSGASFALAAREGLLIPSGVDLAGTSAGDLRGGAGPEYLAIHLDESARCIGVALIGSTSPEDAAIPAGWMQLFLRIPCDAPAREGTESFEFADACGSFAAPRAVAVEGFSFEPETIGSSVVVTEGPIGGFIRGDVNFDTSMDIADAIAALSFLFGGQPHECHDAVDANDDGKLDIADAIYLLSYLFAHGPAPAPPFDAPGVDPTPDAIDCARFPY